MTIPFLTIFCCLLGGIAAAGIGRELLKKEFVDRRDYAAITQRAAEIRQWIQEARGR